MGILDFWTLVEDNAATSLTEKQLDDYCDRKVAVDASICINDFLKEIHRVQYKGRRTGHLLGMWQRVVRFLQIGIVPIYVFDGPPPHMKKVVLDRREAIRVTQLQRLQTLELEKQKLELRGATQDGYKAISKEIQELRKNTIKATQEHYADCKLLLQYMGVPVIQAPSEAEALCSHLCKDHKVHAVASRDSDCFPFGATRVLKSFNITSKVREFDRAQVLNGFELDSDQLIDLCIICGCDYCDGVKGIKAQEALQLVRQYGSIENIMAN